ncbi:cysteine-rich CWC family protein [Vibrio aphrogenes]|uniref:cysteine-rich CWC family protein n=1 Tax=Vibrio aphrogenes TaxID=1891186 RepID=UPI000B35FAED|nr:cysteine-rich CWC family protein [Vibrio aphrogenes]
MKTPCIAACKNNGGICAGCHRTVAEIREWRMMTDQQHQQIIEQLQGQQHTHFCPQCAEPSHCDLAAGKTSCWCFQLEERERSPSPHTCLCRSCLEKQPLK